jgi:CAAX amino terminal protease family.
MRFKASFSNKSGLTQLWLLFFLIITGLLIASILSVTFFINRGIDEGLQDPGALRLLQAISTVCSFLLPAIALAWLCSESLLKYLSLEKSPSVKVCLLTLAGLLLLGPTINMMTLLNKQLVLPSFLEPIEMWMRSKEAEMEKFINLLIQDNSTGALISNLVVIALLAAVTEEILFRGAIQRIIEKWTNNHHVVIWLAAIVFSAVHMQFYGFIPRMMLGAYLGYLLYWSKSMWLPIFAHFVNNAIAVVATRNLNPEDSYNEFITGDIKSEHLLGYAIAAVLTFGLFCLLNKKLAREAKEAD